MVSNPVSDTRISMNRAPFTASGLLVLVALGGMACSKSSSPTSTEPDAGRPVAAACDEAAAAAAVDRLGKRSFPDNPDVSWRALGQKTRDRVAYVEVEPTPDEVGYPRFVFAIGCEVAGEPKLYGAYALDGGSYTLLFTSDDAPPLPATPP
jgi:hypothetical protein